MLVTCYLREEDKDTKTVTEGKHRYNNSYLREGRQRYNKRGEDTDTRIVILERGDRYKNGYSREGRHRYKNSYFREGRQIQEWLFKRGETQIQE